LSREAQQAHLNGYAQPVGVAAPLPDQRLIGFAERVMPNQMILIAIGIAEQALPLGGR
jgi:hypothetical protein